jgi:endonuclease-3
LNRPDKRKISRILDTLSGGEYRASMLGSFSNRRTPFQILIATILSARSRDEMTEEICVDLFKRYPTAPKLAAAKRSELIPILKKIGFYRQKSRYIIETSQILLDKHRGKVPKTLEELIRLPGVGRKVANCVLVYAFGIPAIAVDTHVHRISNRLGWLKTKTPEQTERELAEFLPKKYWLAINDLLVCHGKEICKPITPLCDRCAVRRMCAQVVSSPAGRSRD